MWQKLFANPIDSVISAVTGRIMGAQKWGSEPHVKQLTNDLGVLAERGGPVIKAKIGKNGQLITDMSQKGQLALLTKKESNKVLTNLSMCENKHHQAIGPQNDETFLCDVNGCNGKFSTLHRLTTHKVRTHGYRDIYRCLVIDKFCPMCKNEFASKHGAQNHIQKVCGKKGTEAERKAKVDKILRNRAIVSGEISAISAYMGQ